LSAVPPAQVDPLPPLSLPLPMPSRLVTSCRIAPFHFVAHLTSTGGYCQGWKSTPYSRVRKYTGFRDHYWAIRIYFFNFLYLKFNFLCI
jgi:hypothetical protein